MIRTRIREDQGVDSDFLSEGEGGERFVIKDGYGYNPNTNVTLDGYLSFKNRSTPSSNDGYSHIYSQNNLLYSNSSLGNFCLTPFSSAFAPVLKFGGVTQSTNYNLAYYTTMADIVFLTISMEFVRSSDTGLVTISIPEASKNVANLNQTLLLGGFDVVQEAAVYGSTSVYGTPKYADTTAASEQVLAHISPGVTTLTLRKLGANIDLLAEGLPSRTLTLSVSGFYFK